ncbi:MAG: hypothetical protein KDH96_12085, partial [Candidatus Riesia sp.]|nr:hypothetical protein [Candidatus Riesia sp.]
MQKYINGYIYPPRPKNKAPIEDIYLYDNGTFLGQPKLNGSCCSIFTNDDKIMKMGRHNNVLTRFDIQNDEIFSVFGYDTNVVVGEYMNKSKMNENGEIFNNKFVIFDQIVKDGDYLIGTTFSNRIDMMMNRYKPISETKYLYKLSDNIYMVKTFDSDLEDLWNEITKIDMYEGLVLKMKNGRLKRGDREDNNTST